MSRPKRRRLEDVVEYFQTCDSDIETDDSDDEPTPLVPLLPDLDESSDDDNAPSTSSRPAASRRPPTQRARRQDDYDWTQDLDGYGATPPFTGHPTMNVPDSSEEPLDFFYLFFNDAKMKIIKAETNRYAAPQLHTRQLPPDSLYSSWKTLTLNDLRAFFAIWIHMSVVKKHAIKDYWSEMEIIHTSFAGRLMSQNRFMQILGLLHLNNNDTQKPYGNPGHDPLHKLRPIVDTLLDMFKRLLIPMQKLVIDKAICPWRGNLRFRVYMKDKPNKWEIKFYMLCESSSAYVWSFEIYCAHPELSNKPTDVCKRLMGPLLYKGYILYTDNYYTCPTLSMDLLQADTMTVGTVRANRVGMPKELANVTLNKGDMSYRRHGALVAVRWQDKKSVNMLSTIHDPRATVNVRSRHQVKEKPVVVQDYNINTWDRQLGYARFLCADEPMHNKMVEESIHTFIYTCISTKFCFVQQIKKG